MTREALLVIDVDSGNGWGNHFEDYGRTREHIGGAIKNFLDEERKTGGLVVFVMLDCRSPDRQVSQVCSDDIREEFILREDVHCIGCGPTYTHLAPFLGHRHGEYFEPVFVKKNEEDAFTNGELVDFLCREGVTTIRIIGCNTFQCIRATARGALEHGFHVTLLKDGTYPPFVSKNEQVAWKKSLELFLQKPNEILRVVVQ